MFPFLRDRGGRALAYPLSAIAFAGLHMNFSGLALYLAIALVLAWAYDRWRSVTVTFTAHAVYNLVVVLVASRALEQAP